MPPFPAAAGGGPGQASCILLEVRLSAKHPHVSHQCTVPDVTSVCFLPPPPFFKPSAATSLVNTLALAPSHFAVASFIYEVDLPLQAVHSQQCPDKASSMLCPPLAAGTTCFFCLAPLFFLPSTPAFLSALILSAAIAFHREASESRKGKSGALFATWVAMPIHLALDFAAE